MFLGDSSHSLHDALLLLSPSSTECNTSAPPPSKRFKGASASHPATTTKAALSNQKLKEDLIKRIERFSTSLKSLANNDDFVQPISTFLRSYENIRTKPHLSSALFTFGNTSSSVTARTLPIVIDGGRTKPTSWILRVQRPPPPTVQNANTDILLFTILSYDMNSLHILFRPSIVCSYLAPIVLLLTRPTHITQ